MNNHYTERPLTKQMVEILRDCHDRELQDLEPCDASTMKSIRALVSRGVLITKSYVTKTGKQIIGAYVTELGKHYLGRL